MTSIDNLHKQPLISLLSKSTTTSLQPSVERLTSPNSSYTILVQHSLSLNQRINCAMPSEIALSPKEKALYSNANVMDPEETARRDSSGCLLVLKLLETLIKVNNGEVIFVELVGNTGIKESLGNDESWIKFKERGVLIDAYSDPLGWDATELLSNDNKIQISTYLSQLKSLQHLAKTIFRAMMRVGERCLSSDAMKIPVIFDSISPIINFHGIDVTMSFLNTIRCFSQPLGSQSVMISPLIIPTTLGSVSIPEHRDLEAFSADSMVTLYRGQLQILKRSRVTGKVTSEEQSFVLLGPTLNLFKLGWNDKSESHMNQPVTKEPLHSHKLEGSEVQINVAQNKAARRKQKIILSHDEDARPVVAQAATRDLPKIFIQEDDPEFNDIDEEDPDDDLDI